MIRLALLALFLTPSYTYASTPTPVDRCVCLYTVMFSTATAEELKEMRQEIKEEYNQTLEQRTEDRCKTFIANGDRFDGNGGIERMFAPMINKCLKTRKK